MRELFRRWWRGRSVPPPENDPESPVFFVSLGHYDRHWTARFVSWVFDGLRQHKVGSVLLLAILATIVGKVTERLLFG